MLKLALPKGRLLKGTRELFHRAEMELLEYTEDSRSYRPRCPDIPELWLKVFQEKDIPVQVAVGNYDLGICGLDWVEELLTKYPYSSVVKVRDLGYGKCDLCLATSSLTGISSIEGFKERAEILRIASEYPNLAEAFALNLRLKRFKVFPLWGAAEVYPPENAELVVIPCCSQHNLFPAGLVPVTTILHSRACLIANRSSWERKDMSFFLDPLCSRAGRVEEAGGDDEEEVMNAAGERADFCSRHQVSDLLLALPDGHQQPYTLELLKEAGIEIQGYSLGQRRPILNFEGVKAKVIRPQDMPLQVANGGFDLAITGKDWLYDHLSKFPSSPVREMLDLGFGKVRIVAVVSQELPVHNVYELRNWAEKATLPLRVASEYVNIADKYAREHHLSPYRVIPTWGASEVFLPEDADLLIENTQTGKTIAQHKLKIIDTLFESSACIIGNAYEAAESPKRERIVSFLRIFQQAKERGNRK